VARALWHAGRTRPNSSPDVASTESPAQNGGKSGCLAWEVPSRKLPFLEVSEFCREPTGRTERPTNRPRLRHPLVTGGSPSFPPAG
jgi:hypothetical protein